MSILGVYFSQKPKEVQLEREVTELLESSGLSFSAFIKYMLEDRHLILDNKKSTLNKLMK